MFQVTKPTGLQREVEMEVKYDNKVDPGDVVAVGDIHGRYDLFEVFLETVRNTEAIVILLGDLIDRGPEDLKVLERARQLTEDPESWGLSGFFVLMGNHEAMFVDAMQGDGADLVLWLNNGGNFEAMPDLREHLEWVESLPVYLTIGDTVFVHAGVHPGQDPFKVANSDKWQNLVWMREPFMTNGPQLDKWSDTLKRVVHGHTPYFEDDLLGQVNVSKSGDRVGIDTGAYFTNILTSYNTTQNTFTQHTVQTDA
jgi:serine/threonine protein phosphatase 1